MPISRLRLRLAVSTAAIFVVGLGAADFGLFSWLRALARRPPATLSATLRVGDLEVDTASRAARRQGRQIKLTAREYALLEYFLRNVGRVLTRPMIAQHVWGLDFDTESNIIDVYVGYLRRKIDGEGERRLLHTVRGAGYMLGRDA